MGIKFAFLMTPGMLSLPAQVWAGQSVLGSSDQIALDRLAVEIFHTPEVVKEKAELAPLFAQDPLAATADGKARMAAALDALAFASIPGR